MKKEKQSSTLMWVVIILVALALAVGVYFYLDQSRRLTSSDRVVTTDNNQAAATTSITAVEVTQNFADEYSQVPADNLFVYRSGEEIVDILSHGTGIVYLGFEECPWCQAYAPLLNEIATEAGLEKIYYFDIRQDRADNTPLYQEIVALLGDNLLFDDEGQPRIYVPDTTFVKNGEIIAHDNYTSMNTEAENGTPAEFWTADRVAEFKDLLRGYVEPLRSADCSAAGSICN